MLMIFRQQYKDILYETITNVVPIPRIGEIVDIALTPFKNFYGEVTKIEYYLDTINQNNHCVYIELKEI